jgi:hypothetical protein
LVDTNFFLAFFAVRKLINRQVREVLRQVRKEWNSSTPDSHKNHLYKNPLFQF